MILMTYIKWLLAILLLASPVSAFNPYKPVINPYTGYLQLMYNDTGVALYPINISNSIGTLPFLNIAGVPCFNCSIPFANITGYTDDDSSYSTIAYVDAQVSVINTTISNVSMNGTIMTCGMSCHYWNNLSTDYYNKTQSDNRYLQTDDDTSYLPITTYNGNFPNSSLINYLLISNLNSTFDHNASNLTFPSSSSSPAMQCGISCHAAITNLTANPYTMNASNLSSGTVPVARLTRTVPVFQLNSTATCSHTAAASNLMMGLGVNYTTSANTAGTIFATLNFQITSPATISLFSTYKIAWGTGTAPVCNAAATGTVVGQAYVFKNSGTAITAVAPISETVAISGLSASTTYWIDVQALDSSTASGWIYSLPQMTVIEP